MSSSLPTTTSTTSPTLSYHKGKHTHRSWPQLPEELVRHIATFYLWNRATTTYTPATWDSRQAWHHRMVYTTLRDAFDLERNFMSVCPQWGLALETHLFWQQAVTLVDPTDSLGHLSIIHPHPDLARTSSIPLRPYRITPYRHFRHVINCSCLICRINLPATTRGLTLAKRSINTFFLGPIGLCRDHDHRRLAFCGFCLRESPLYELAGSTLYTTADPQVAVLENEDEETWPGIEATCRNCRQEWLWKKANLNPRDQEAIGGPEMLSDDWETRQSVEGFVELAEGTITDVINLAREKYWLRKFTRLGDMMQQALAAAKFNNNYPSSRSSSLRGSDPAAAADYTSWDEEEDEEEDTELMQLEEGGVKDLALGDWARTRILDGYWISPADIWYRNTVPGKPLDAPAIHPCPWTIEDHKEPSHHPSPTIVKAEMPPSFSLCEQAFLAHGQQLRLILLPAMKNVVRRLAIECVISMGSEDPTLKASRMSLEEVARILREEEGIWFDGYDWIERRRNDDDTRRENSRRARAEEDARSTTSSSSGESVVSDTTSPVLSTTTLQTTPSPPPLAYEKKEEEPSWDSASVAERVVIPVEPVLDPPRILRSIPHIPVTLTHLPQYSIDAFKNVWREACAPLYHCRCRICERAVAVANNVNSPVQQRQQQPQAHQQRTGAHQQKQFRTQEAPVQIQLEETPEVEFVEEDGEETGDDEGYEICDEEDEDEDDEGEEEEDEDEEVEERVTLRIPAPPVIMTTTRKRSSDEIEDREEHTRRGTPPKRLRQSLGAEKAKLVTQSGRIQRKRSSEELDEGEVCHGGSHSVEKKKKRARLEENVVRVGSLSPATWGKSRVRSRSGSGSVTSRSQSRSASPPLSASADRSGSAGASTSEVGDDEDYATWYNGVKAREIRVESASASGDEEGDVVRSSEPPGEGGTT